MEICFIQKTLKPGLFSARLYFLGGAKIKEVDIVLLSKKIKPYFKMRASSLAIFLLIFTLSAVVNPNMAMANSQTGLPDQIMLSWTDDPVTTQTIVWRSSADTKSEWVQYLSAADYNDSFIGALEVAAVKTELYAGYSHCEGILSELSPDSEYIYRVGREGAWSEPASFTTGISDDKFSFVYMGDVQKGYENWGEMLQHIVAENPSLKFGLLGGDLVDDGYNTDEWELFFNAASPVFNKIPLMPAVGNHDDTPIFWKFFALPENGPEGFKEEFYSFDYGNCHIAVLNSNKMGAAKPYYDKLKCWLQQDIENSSQQWKLLMFHYPPYPVVDDGHSYNFQESWVPLFEQCGVDIVFVGHQHVYMRTKPLRNGQVQADGEGIVYVIGNSGSKFYPGGDNHDYIAHQETNISSYQIVTINGNTFTLIARNADGQETDSYTLSKPSPYNSQHNKITPLWDAYNSENIYSGASVMTINDIIFRMKYFCDTIKAYAVNNLN
jgi:hypothetical protein